MKKLISSIAFIAASAMLLASCSKSSPATKPTTTTTGKFVATVGGDAFSAPDAYIMPAAGGTIAVMAKDAKGRSFSIAIFEKDFPLNKAVEVAYSPSISYVDAASQTYIAKSGTMTITAYGKASNGTVNNLKGNFDIVVTRDGADISIKEGSFDVNTK